MGNTTQALEEEKRAVKARGAEVEAGAARLKAKHRSVWAAEKRIDRKTKTQGSAEENQALLREARRVCREEAENGMYWENEHGIAEDAIKEQQRQHDNIEAVLNKALQELDENSKAEIAAINKKLKKCGGKWAAAAAKNAELKAQVASTGINSGVAKQMSKRKPGGSYHLDIKTMALSLMGLEIPASKVSAVITVCIKKLAPFWIEHAEKLPGRQTVSDWRGAYHHLSRSCLGFHQSDFAKFDNIVMGQDGATDGGRHGEAYTMFCHQLDLVLFSQVVHMDTKKSEVVGKARAEDIRKNAAVYKGDYDATVEKFGLKGVEGMPVPADVLPSVAAVVMDHANNEEAAVAPLQRAKTAALEKTPAYQALNEANKKLRREIHVFKCHRHKSPLVMTGFLVRFCFCLFNNIKCFFF